MQRLITAAALYVLCLSAASATQAELQQQTASAPEAQTIATTQPLHTQRLSGEEQGAFSIVFSENCYTELEALPEYSELSKRLGRDISRPYCGCMATRASSIANRDDLRYLGDSGILPPNLQLQMVEEAKNCMKFSLAHASR